MKITTIDEFKEILDFAFSKDFFNLKMSEQEKVKEELISAIDKIDGTHELMKKALLYEFKTLGYRFNGNKNKIFFIFKQLSEENRIQIVTDYLNEKIEDKHYKGSYVKINLDVLLPMLDILTEEQKIKAFSKLKNKKLLQFMSQFNTKFNESHFFSKEKMYYKNYYSICQKALELKEAR